MSLWCSHKHPTYDKVYQIIQIKHICRQLQEVQDQMLLNKYDPHLALDRHLDIKITSIHLSYGSMIDF